MEKRDYSSCVSTTTERRGDECVGLGPHSQRRTAAPMSGERETEGEIERERERDRERQRDRERCQANKWKVTRWTVTVWECFNKLETI